LGAFIDEHSIISQLCFQIPEYMSGLV